MKFSEIKQFPFASHRSDVSWGHLNDWLANINYGIDLDPEFQRGFVWTEKQQREYIEYRLKGGYSGKDIFWNCPNWLYWSKNEDKNNIITLVDGKQRINAVQLFLDNKIKVFGHYLNQYEDHDRILNDMGLGFVFHINKLKTDKEVVEWYLGMNTGGSTHTLQDLQTAYDMLNKN